MILMKKVPVDDSTVNVVYHAAPTAQKFHASSALVRGIKGPVGGGKTVACIMELYTRALEQRPYRGVRYSRFALIRNTYNELLSTTLNTFEEWIPRSICPVRRSSPIMGTLKVGLEDGTRVEAEFYFLSMDDEDDAKKLKSLELTGGFINEASEIRESALHMLISRLGRYPPTRWDVFTWKGVVMDTNPPDNKHWWYRLAEDEKPKNHVFFDQPPALIRVAKVDEKTQEESVEYVPNDGTHGISAAENIRFLPGASSENPSGGFDYYLDQVPGKPEEWIKVFLQGDYGVVVSGKPVYPEYSDKIHLAKDVLEPLRGPVVLLCFDFGLTPSCIFLQQTPRGQVRVLDELVSEDMGLERFTRDVVKPFLSEKRYSGCSFFGVGDPAGAARGQATEVTCFDVLERAGLSSVPAPSNVYSIRRDSVAWFLNKMVDGMPGFLLSPNCEILRSGFISGYHFRKMKVPGTDRYAETPDKNEFSHPHDAVQYGCSHLRRDAVNGASVGLGSARGVRREVVPGSHAGWS